MSQLSRVVLIFLIFFKSSLSDEVCGPSGTGDPTLCFLLNTIRDIIKYGSTELGIPSLDPIKLDNFSLPLESEALKGNLSFENFAINMLSKFSVTNSTNLLLFYAVEIDFSVLQVYTKYDGRVKIMDMIDLYGTGDLSLLILNLNLKIEAGLQFKKIKLNVSLKMTSEPEFNARFTGLLGDDYMSDIISRQLSDTLTTLLAERLDVLNTLLTQVIQQLVDEFINPILPHKVVNEEQLTHEEVNNIVMGVLKELVHSKMLTKMYSMTC